MAREAAWERVLNFSSNVPFPSLPGELLYGDLSSSIHAPSLKTVYVSDEEEAASLEFFTEAAGFLKRKVEAYSEAEAALAPGLG